MTMVGYFCGRDHKDAAEYEPLPSSSPVEPWEEEGQQARQQARFLKVRKSMLSLWSIAIFGTVFVVTTLFVLLFIAQPYAVYLFQPSTSTTAHAFEDNKNATECATKWVEEISPLVSPVMCHSHNDYLRRRPLFSALSVGCASVEADVWLTSDGKDLMVGHHRIFLSKSRTLQSLYINPLLQILDSMNQPSAQTIEGFEGQTTGVFASQPDKTLILFIDIKSDPEKTWPVVLEQLKPLSDKGYLSRHERITSGATNQTFWNGPITVVGTGSIVNRRDVNMGSDPERWRQYHDVFLDAPLDKLVPQRIGDVGLQPEENEYYTASVGFGRVIGFVLSGFTRSQLHTLREQIQAAKNLGLLSRYWDTPTWPISYRDYVWKVLVREGISLLNADDVVSAASRRWSSGYIRESIWMCGTASYLLAFSITLVWLGRRMIHRKLSTI